MRHVISYPFVIVGIRLGINAGLVLDNSYHNFGDNEPTDDADN